MSDCITKAQARQLLYSDSSSRLPIAPKVSTLACDCADGRRTDNLHDLLEHKACSLFMVDLILRKHTAFIRVITIVRVFAVRVTKGVLGYELHSFTILTLSLLGK